ncbi:conserved hypothetical protein [Neospora caninum Liverpool]|uniref:Uncharacterized protein n=1 Tax=Neospora caninum (strain Liverpool) TaxID=572307 RepID=F0V9G6_NEOCL|nr:conserved hypothetical protein [Neospora caninum Liverpool]CBZ50391.1 conserved hypothetical protein [Neospora caninum Liverpool]CEL64999.1 TPA: hypothetical protein BN1204_008600 [Neospora caninum Liverpool]|eukprot:XP_003880425.1 conserved hypothetical protein [Neospora caninum Liverpool]
MPVSFTSPSPSISLWTSTPFPYRQWRQNEPAGSLGPSAADVTCSALPSSSSRVAGREQTVLHQQPLSPTAGLVDPNTCSRERDTTDRPSGSPADSRHLETAEAGEELHLEAPNTDASDETETPPEGDLSGRRRSEWETLSVSRHISPTQIQFSPRQERSGSPPSLEGHTSNEGACAPRHTLDIVLPSVAVNHEAPGPCSVDEQNTVVRRNLQTLESAPRYSSLIVPHARPFPTAWSPVSDSHAAIMIGSGRHSPEAVTADRHAASLTGHRTTTIAPVGLSGRSVEAAGIRGAIEIRGDHTTREHQPLVGTSRRRLQEAHNLSTRHDELRGALHGSPGGVRDGRFVSVRQTLETTVLPVVAGALALREFSPPTLHASAEGTTAEPSRTRRVNGSESTSRTVLLSPQQGATSSLSSVRREAIGNSATQERATEDGQWCTRNCMFPSVGPSMTGRDLFLLEMWLAPELCRDLQPPSTLGELRRQLLNLWEEKLTAEQREVYNEVIVRRYTEERQGVEEWKFENAPPWWKKGS